MTTGAGRQHIMSSTRVIAVSVTVANVPDHISDQAVIDTLGRQVSPYLEWPAPRSYVVSAAVIPATEDAPAEDTATVSEPTA